MMDTSQDTYIDPWQEYRAISAKLKKRFLRRPNVAEATREFGMLAARLTDEDCPQYAGLCHLAIARCEHTAGNVSAETTGLKDASRLFMEAEKERNTLGLPGFSQNLSAAIHCYGHAIKTHVEQKQVALAACLSLELGVNLFKLERYHEAVEHFERSARYFDQDPINKAFSLEWLVLTQVELGKFTEALLSIDSLWNVAEKMGGSVGQNTSRVCEIGTTLLLLELRALPAHMNERQTRLMQIYTWVPDPGGNEAVPPATSEVKSEEEFLLLQSFVMSVQWKEAGDADFALTQLVPKLKSPLLLLLGLDIVQKLYDGDYPTD